MSLQSASTYAAVLAACVLSVDSYAIDSEMRKANVLTSWPQPGKEYYGFSHIGRWTYEPSMKFPRRNLVDVPGFSDLPNPDPQAATRPPQPTTVLATPPFRLSHVSGNCTIPRSGAFDSSGATQWGAHVWIANLLYSEFIPWPMDVWVGKNAAMDHPTEAGSLLFPFRIPLFDHVNNPDSPLFWHRWAAGMSGKVHQAFVGAPATPEYQWIDEASSSWSSSTPMLHSWSSFGAGEWTVLCNSWVSSPEDGSLRVSQYKALEDMEQDLAAARAAGTRYSLSLDSIDGTGRSRWDEGHEGAWLHGMNGASLVAGTTTGVTGKWGKSITFDPQWNYKQECCWRSYTGPGNVMRGIHNRTGSNLTMDDCCWFGLPPHTEDPLYPSTAQPPMDASVFKVLPDYTNERADIAYWGYRRNTSVRPTQPASVSTIPGVSYPMFWGSYGGKQVAAQTSSPLARIEWGGVTLAQPYAFTDVSKYAAGTPFEVILKSVHTDEWVLEYTHVDMGLPPTSLQNMTELRMTADIGTTACHTINCGPTFRISTHGWNSIRQLEPVMTAGGFGTTLNPVPFAAFGIPFGVKQSFAIRLTSRPTPAAYLAHPAVGMRPAPSPTILRYANGGVGVGSTPWNFVTFTVPAIPHGSISIHHPPFDMAAANQGRGTYGWAQDAPNTDAYVGWPFTFNASEMYAMHMFADAAGETAYDDLTFTFSINTWPWRKPATNYDKFGVASAVSHDLDKDGYRTWDADVRLGRTDESAQGWYPPALFNSAKVEGGWSVASFTLIPRELGKLYVVNITVSDGGWSSSMKAGKGYGLYDRSRLAGPSSVTMMYYVSARVCDPCVVGMFPIQGCKGRGQPAVCAACSTGCGLNQYIAAPCSAGDGSGGIGADLQCAACPLICPLGHRLSKKCTGTDSAPSTCLQCSLCPAGSFASGGCNGTLGGTTDTLCTPCPITASASATGTVYVPTGCPLTLTGGDLTKMIANDPSANLTALQPAQTAVQYRFRSCASCSAGSQYTAQACTSIDDTVCASCSAPCGAGTFTSAACTPEHDRACTPCTTTCPTNKYRAAACSLSADTSCAPCTAVCPPFTFQTGPCAATADTQCTTCNCSSSGTSGCDSITGTCMCKPGFTGARCDACIPGLWGSACDQTCACSAGQAVASTSCAARDGKCSCVPGASGFYCEGCSAGSYGPACAGSCACGPHGRCSDGKAGDGSCLCFPGWAGPTCALQTAESAVFPDAPLAPLAAKEGVALSIHLPTTAFALFTLGVKSPLSSAAVNVSLHGSVREMAWLRIERSAGSPSGFILTGTPTRGSVTGTEVSVVVRAVSSAGEANATLHLTVSHANTPPSFPDPAIAPVTLRVGTLWRLALALGVGKNVSDIDVGLYGDSLTVEFAGVPPWSSVQGVARDGDGDLLWCVMGVPPTSSAGMSWSVTISVTDGSGAEVSTSASVSVSSMASQPPALAFVGVPPVHVSEGSTLSWSLPAHTFSVHQGEGTQIVRYETRVEAVVTRRGRRQLMGMDMSMGRMHGGRALSVSLPPVAAYYTHYAAAVANARGEGGERKGRRIEGVNTDTSIALTNSDPSEAFQAGNAAEAESDMDDRAIRSLDLSALQAEAEARTLAAAGACAWLSIARSTTGVPLPLLIGTPGPFDGGSVCNVIVTATNAAGYAVSGPIAVHVDDKNGASPCPVLAPVSLLTPHPHIAAVPLPLTSLPLVTRPAAKVFTLTWPMKDLFSDPDMAPVGSLEVLSFSIAELGSAGGAPAFLSLTCSPQVTGAVIGTCTLRGNASSAEQGSYGMEIVARDVSGDTARIPLLLHIGPPSVSSLSSTAWTACTVPCGVGERYRTHSCVDYMGRPVDADNCAAELSELGTSSLMQAEACNVEACNEPYWITGGWGDCSAPCASLRMGYNHNGSMMLTRDAFDLPHATRAVACMAASGLELLSDASCTRDKPAVQRTCNAQACVDSASQAGRVPSAMEGRDGITDLAGVSCHAPNPSGLCCLGVSNNSAIDDCGVCDGLNECSLSNVITLSSPGLTARVCGAGVGSAQMNETIMGELEEGLQHAVAVALAINASDVSVESLTCVPSTSGTRQLAASSISTQLSLGVALSPSVRMGTGEVQSRIAARLPTQVQAVTGEAVLAVSSSSSRGATCGNGVCEGAETGHDACPTDCGAPAQACPADTDGRPCSGQGTCNLGSGVCACARGYAGTACTACAEGYSAGAGARVCIALVRAVTPTAAPALAFTTTAGFGVVALIGSVICAGLLLLVIRRAALSYSNYPSFKAVRDHDFTGVAQSSFLGSSMGTEGSTASSKERTGSIHSLAQTSNPLAASLTSYKAQTKPTAGVHHGSAGPTLVTTGRASRSGGTAAQLSPHPDSRVERGESSGLSPRSPAGLKRTVSGAAKASFEPSVATADCGIEGALGSTKNTPARRHTVAATSPHARLTLNKQK